MNSRRKISEIKAEKFFKLKDVIVYALLLVLIFVLFLAFVIIKPDRKLSGFTVTVSENKQETAYLTYDFAADEFTINQEYSRYVKIDSAEYGYDVTVFDADGDYNVLAVEKSGKVYVKDANCSNSRDCMLFPPITKGNDVIICVPHSLTVLGLGEGEEPPVVIG